MIKRSKKVELQFYDFETHSFDHLEVDHVKVEYTTAGDLRSNGKTIQTKNAATFIKQYSDETAFDDMLLDFFTGFGGSEVIKNTVDVVAAKQSFVRLHVPVFSSSNNQDDNICPEIMQQILDAKLSLDFWFV